MAAEVGMAPSTLYRHFRIKEDIVMWDEHDAAIDRWQADNAKQSLAQRIEESLQQLEQINHLA